MSDPALPGEIAALTHQQCKPLDNVPYEAGYRRKMIRVHTRRAVEELLSGE